MNKKMNNKGFSLVELIIVIAIMAILVGVLAPQYIKYVEKSRKSTDIQTLDSIHQALETVVMDPEYASELAGLSSNITVVFGSNALSINNAGTSMTAAITDILGGDLSKVVAKSKAGKKGITVVYDYQDDKIYYQDSDSGTSTDISGLTDDGKVQ